MFVERTPSVMRFGRPPTLLGQVVSHCSLLVILIGNILMALDGMRWASEAKTFNNVGIQGAVQS